MSTTESHEIFLKLSFQARLIFCAFGTLDNFLGAEGGQKKGVKLLLKRYIFFLCHIVGKKHTSYMIVSCYMNCTFGFFSF